MIPFGSYFLVQRLAVGGMSEVFLAAPRSDDGSGRLVVVKRILPHLQAKPHFVQMFVDEAELSRRLQHPNLVHAQDSGQAEDLHYMAMEFVDGMPLSRALSLLDRERIPDDLACWIAAEVCAGLAYAHGLTDSAGELLGVVHRDISPDNILLGRAGEVKLADFGVAKGALQMARTQPGQVKGKLAYMSPEQAMRLAVDRRSDIFSLGNVLYELVTGQRLFPAKNQPQLLRALYHQEFTPPEQLRPDLPPGLLRVLERALQWNPGARHDSAAELRDALLLMVPDPTAQPAQLAELVTRLESPKPRCTAGASPRPGREVTQPATASRGGATSRRQTILGVGELQRILANYAAGAGSARVTEEIPQQSAATIHDGQAPVEHPSGSFTAAELLGEEPGSPDEQHPSDQWITEPMLIVRRRDDDAAAAPEAPTDGDPAAAAAAPRQECSGLIVTAQTPETEFADATEQVVRRRNTEEQFAPGARLEGRAAGTRLVWMVVAALVLLVTAVVLLYLASAR